MKRLAIPLIIILVLILTSLPVYAADINVTINGKSYEFNPAPIIQDGSALVPMRQFFEAMGAKVYWNNEIRTVTGVKGERFVQITIGSDTAYVDGQARPLSAAAKIIGASTYIPLRFIGVALDSTVNYDEKTSSITISYKEKVSDGLSTVEIAKNQKSVGSILGYNKKGEELSQGSGFVIDSSGLIVTNYHVISGIDSAVFSLGEKDYKISGIKYYDKDKDIAVLKAEGQDFPYVTLGDSDSLEVGQKVVAIGSPLGFNNIVSEGIISAIRDGEVQFTAPISEGSSGGALFNDRGEVIGITFATYGDSQNLNLAIPINEVRELLKGQAADTTFADLKKDMSYDDFAQYLADNYSYANINGSEIWLDWFSVSDSEDGEIIILAAFEGEDSSYGEWVKAVNENKKDEITVWLGKILSEVEAQYPGKTIGGGVYYTDTLTEYPKQYDAKEIERNEDGTYNLTHMAAFFSNMGGKHAVVIY